MSINLKKGNSFNLTKNEPGLKKIMVGLGWEFAPNVTLDLDSSALILGANGKLLSDNHFIFYNNLKSPDGSIEHKGDNRTGKGEDDDELILANLSVVDPSASEILVVVTIHDSNNKGHHFGQLKEAYIRLFDFESKREILKYDLDDEFAPSSEVIVGKFTKDSNNEWHFTAVGIGSKIGLQGIIEKYA